MTSPPPKIEDFQLLDKLGSGTYATVYRCFKKVIKEQLYTLSLYANPTNVAVLQGSKPREDLAIKCVDKKKLSKNAVDNLITEIRLLKSLKHEHIVEMKDFLWDDS